jgi:filamentous hemagglutinin family protein
MGILRKLKTCIRYTILGLALTGLVSANPSGPNVRHGQVHYLPGNQAQIQQLTDRAIVDWQSFSVGANESLQIFQPSTLSVMLNRVVGGDASSILGSLQANGNVWLINPNGILFGPNSEVSVAGLVASTLSITDQDFLAGNYTFQQDANFDLAAVVNQGKITISDAGYAVLTGPSVINEGTIIARTGNVVLAAGETATLNLDGRDLIHFSLDGEVSDGTVLLGSGMMSESIAETLGVEQAARADRLIRLDDGSVRMVNSSGTLVHSGTVSVDGRDNADAGSVLLDSADLTLVAEGSVTSASGSGENSNAGEVLVLSDIDGDDSHFGRTVVEAGSSLAAAGGDSGDAGFIEVSGELVHLAADIDLSRTDGEAGHFLLDPPDMRVVDGNLPATMVGLETHVGDGWIESQLASGDVTLMAAGSLTLDVTSTAVGPPDTGIQAPGATNVLTLDTATVAGGTFIDFNGDDVIVGGDLVVDSADDILLGSGDIQVGGDASFTGGGALDLESAQITANSVFIDVPGNIDGDGASIDTRGSLVDFSDGGGIDILNQSTIDLDNTDLRFADTLDIFTDGGDIDLTDSLIESEFDTFNLFLADVFLNADNGSILLTDTNVFGNNVDLTAFDSVSSLGTFFQAEISADSDLTSISSDFVADTLLAGGNIDVSAFNTLQLGSANAFGVTLTGGDLLLDDALIDGQDLVELTGDSVSLLGASRVTTRRAPFNLGMTSFEPEIRISSLSNIRMDFTQSEGLQGHRVFLATPDVSSTESINVAIDTTRTNPSDGGIVLTAVSGGAILIRDLASVFTNEAGGIELARPGGVPGTTPLDPSAISSSSGPIFIQSSGKVDFGLGDRSTVADLGLPLVVGTGSVQILGFLDVVDRNSTPTSPDLLEVDTVGPVEIRGVRVGDFINGDEGRIEVDGESLVVFVSGAGATLNVASQNELNFIDIRNNGGELLVAEGGVGAVAGQTIRNQPLVVAGPNVLQAIRTSPTAANFVRFTSQSDVLLDNFNVDTGQTVVVRTENDASILNGDPGSGGANVTNNGTLVLNTDAGIGTVSDFLIVDGDTLSVSSNLTAASEVFLDLTPLTGGTVAVQGVDPDYLLSFVPTIPPTVGINPGDIEAVGNIILDVGGDLDVNSVIRSNNGISLATTGAVNLNQGLQAGGNLLIEADQIINGDGGNLDGNGIGLNLNQDFGTSADFINLATESLVLGDRSTADYFLETGGLNQPVTWVDSLTVGNKTITGNQSNVVEHTHTDGDIVVDGGLSAADRVILSATSVTPASIAINSTVDGANRAEVRATGSINQGPSGLVRSASILLDSGADIGAIDNDQQVDGGTLALSAVGNAYVQDASGNLELVDDGTLSGPLGAGQDLRVRVDNGDLTLSGDLTATDAAFVAGTALTIAAQTVGPDIFINSNVTTTQNLVFLSAGDIVMGVGPVLNAGGGLGLGAGGTIGPNNPVVYNAPTLSLNPGNANVQASTTSTGVPFVTSVGVTVNAQANVPDPGPGPDPVPDPEFPTDDFPGTEIRDDDIFGSELAQDNVDLVDEDLAQMLEVQQLLDIDWDPTLPPVGWWDDDDFLRKKFRRKSGRK